MNKVAIVYGDYENEKKALSLLTETILDFTVQYPLCIKYGNEADLSEYTKIYVGTKETNEYIRKNSKAVLTHPEEYAIAVESGTAMIEGSDYTGILYGCADFYNRYIVNCEYTDNDSTYWENPFEKPLADFFIQSHPQVENRGIWTWGHVIYDYKNFIDNMVKLKLNTVTIWNDHAPVNGKEIVEYAHEAGIKVIWGYSWLWDTAFDHIDFQHVNDCITDILRQYEREYLPLGGDGIYFQSFTELDREYIGDVLIAQAVTEFVNCAADAFFVKYPDLELQFGLHANSVKQKLEYISKVDSRVRIVWENCGDFPFWYIPLKNSCFRDTMKFVKEITDLRGSDERFGAVTKGLTKLDWASFEHLDGPVFVGVSSKRMKANRILRKKPIWKYVESVWFTHAGDAKQVVQFMAEAKQGKLYLSALVEDGMFEENIMFPVALYSEILWNPNEELEHLFHEVSRRNYVEFA